jgi:hypothetical protein
VGCGPEEKRQLGCPHSKGELLRRDAPPFVPQGKPDSWLTITALPLPCFSKVFILKVDKVLCFDTLLEVFILKAVTGVVALAAIGKGESTQTGTVLLRCGRRAAVFLGGRKTDFFICGRKTANRLASGHRSLQKS